MKKTETPATSSTSYLVIGNWKCNKTIDQARSWIDQFRRGYTPVAGVEGPLMEADGTSNPAGAVRLSGQIAVRAAVATSSAWAFSTRSPPKVKRACVSIWVASTTGSRSGRSLAIERASWSTATARPPSGDERPRNPFTIPRPRLSCDGAWALTRERR